MALVLGLEACGGNSDRADAIRPTAPKGMAADATCAPSGTRLTISADKTSFDRTCLAAPAGTPFDIVFHNKEAVAHNVTILLSHDSPRSLFDGEIFTGPGTKTYSVGALAAGNYHFHCSVHPDQMNGVLVIE